MKNIILIILLLPFTLNAEDKVQSDKSIKETEIKVTEERILDLEALQQKIQEREQKASEQHKKSLEQIALEEKKAVEKIKALAQKPIEDRQNALDQQKAIEKQVLVDSVQFLKEKTNDLEAKYMHLESVNEQTMSSVSNQLSSASLNLSIFGIAFILVALVLGAYITFVERKIIKLGERSRYLFDQSKAVKKEVVYINDLIQKDIYGLYEKIKREETVYILRRLLEVPYDIINLSTLLLSRDLEKGDFYKLKNAFLKMKSKQKFESRAVMASHEDNYKLVFFQHFLGLAVIDDEIGPDMIDFYSEGIDCSFDNDMIKSTADFINAIYGSGFKLRSKEINSYFKGLSSSHFKDYTDVYKIFFDTLSSRSNRFEFYELLSKENDCKIGRTNFGKLLVEEYSETELSGSEQAIIDEINLMLNLQA